MKNFFLVLIVLAIGSTITSSLMNFTSFSQNNKFRKATKRIENRYIVVLNDAQNQAFSNSEELAQQFASKYQGKVDKTFNFAVKGFAIEMSEEEAEKLSRDERVKYVEEDGEVYLATTQTRASWGLDRIDQQNLPLNGNYEYALTGSGVHAYIIDSGINVSHAEFNGRAVVDYDVFADGQNGIDCYGHGTHVAGIVGGATYGVAKNVTLHSIRVMDCRGSGTVSGVVGAIDYVTRNHIRPAVVNMSLITGVSSTLDKAVANSVAAGITYVVAAGNYSQDACNYSPSGAANAITVGASDSYDNRSNFSNFGACVDVFAPGSGITSAWVSGSTSIATLNGTSMASPHVAGVAALYLGNNPTMTPAAVWKALLAATTRGVIINAGTNSPNLLINSLFAGNGGNINTAATRSLSGAVTYGITEANQQQKFVPGVLMSAIGVSSVSTNADSLGNYLFNNNLKADGQYTVTPSKTASVNGITAFDATLVLRCVAAGASCTLTANQRKAADANADNNLTPFDATQILRYVAASRSNATTGQVGTWKFSPANRTYSNLSSNLSEENYTAFLIGEVNGDWTP